MTCSVLAGPTTFTKKPTVKFAWDPPVEEEKDLIAGYRMHFGRVSGAYTKILDLGMVEKIVEEDGSGAMYSGPVEFEVDETGTWFTVLTAYNTYGLESDYSNEISFTFLPRPSPPGAPREDADKVAVTTEVSTNMVEWQAIAVNELDLKDGEFFRLRFDLVEKKPSIIELGSIEPVKQ